MKKLCFENYVREIYETLETLNLGNQAYFEHLNEEERARLEEIKFKYFYKGFLVSIMEE